MGFFNLRLFPYPQAIPKLRHPSISLDYKAQQGPLTMVGTILLPNDRASFFVTLNHV